MTEEDPTEGGVLVCFDVDLSLQYPQRPENACSISSQESTLKSTGCPS